MRKYEDESMLYFETAILPGLPGLVWTVAAQAGTACIAAVPLEDGKDEAVAQMFATRFAQSPRQRAFLPKWADVKTRRALAALRNLMRIAGELSETLPVRGRPHRELFEAIVATDHLGRMAAKAHRVLAIMNSLGKAVR